MRREKKISLLYYKEKVREEGEKEYIKHKYKRRIFEEYR